MERNTLTNEVIQFMPKGWSVICDKHMNLYLQHDASKAKIGLHIDTYRKKGCAYCVYPSTKNKHYTNKEDFMYRVPELKSFDDSIKFNYEKSAEKIAKDIIRRIIDNGFVPLYAACQTIIDADEADDRARQDLTKKLAEDNGFTYVAPYHFFDSKYNELNDVDLKCKINYKRNIELELKNLDEDQAKQVLAIVASWRIKNA